MGLLSNFQSHIITAICNNAEFFTMNTTIFPQTRQRRQGFEPQACARRGPALETKQRVRDRTVEVVLPQTIKWARSIPSELRPRALVIKFPRIANAMADAWTHPNLFNMLLCQLMLDDRGGRQGFPFDVLQDLANLRVYFDSRYKHPGTDVWCSIADRYKRN